MITSFSGAHPFRPQCVISRITADDWGDLDPLHVASFAANFAVYVTAKIDAGRCPRCEEPLTDYPAGSRVTRCRCIPICPSCGLDESSPTGGVFVDKWPIRPEQRYVHDQPVELVEITPEMAAGVVYRPHPGGWAEFGYDDDADRDEVSR